MKKPLIALAAIATLALATIVASTNADARCRGCGVAAGVLGGIAAGAIIAGAANGGYYAAPPPAPVYVAPEPDYDEFECRIVKQRVWVEGLGYRWRRAEVCD